MIALLLAVARLMRAVWVGLRDPEFRALFALVLVTLSCGTVFCRGVGGWGALDSLYFSAATLSTAGHLDLAPTATVSRIFTIVYVLLGVGVIVGFVGKPAAVLVEARQRTGTMPAGTIRGVSGRAGERDDRGEDERREARG